jgi:hypothetical protein
LYAVSCVFWEFFTLGSFWIQLLSGGVLKPDAPARPYAGGKFSNRLKRFCTNAAMALAVGGMRLDGRWSRIT